VHARAKVYWRGAITLGSARILGQIGKAFAEAMAAMEKKQRQDEQLHTCESSDKVNTFDKGRKNVVCMMFLDSFQLH